MGVIELIHARQILDSRGNPTVEVEVTLEGGAGGPRRRSLGRLDRRVRGDRAARRRRRLGRQGRREAVANVNGEIAEALVGARAADQAAIDER